MMIIVKPQMLHYPERMMNNILVQMILLEKQTINKLNNNEKYKKETSKIKEGNESVDNYETSYNLCDDSIIKRNKTR